MVVVNVALKAAPNLYSQSYVEACTFLTSEQRQQQQHSRETVSRRGNSDRQAKRQTTPAQATSRRVNGKQPPTAGGPCREVDARNFEPTQVLKTFQERNRERRPISLTDLPAPAIPNIWPSLSCPFCLQFFWSNQEIQTCSWLHTDAL